MHPLTNDKFLNSHMKEYVLHLVHISGDVMSKNDVSSHHDERELKNAVTAYTT
ncbi:hypothetical protein DPMN_142991 [Dreissena polymorpha]|uniref:Uncharacterized protein n=1 Tax=Dreissena polymorpha TaxID=45954 RepID=A0A9D4JJN6_DREPO|nr:hypothetical protein DPMN_142991 [Dreissena polymorpha]